jgi:hypothetical protein
MKETWKETAVLTIMFKVSFVNFTKTYGHVGNPYPGSLEERGL